MAYVIVFTDSLLRRTIISQYQPKSLFARVRIRGLGLQRSEFARIGSLIDKGPERPRIIT
jgi:hypothetical protein